MLESRRFRNTNSLFDLTETEIIGRYKLPGKTFLAVLDDIKDDGDPATQRCPAVHGIVLPSVFLMKRQYL